MTQSWYDIIDEQSEKPIVIYANYKELLSDVRSTDSQNGRINFIHTDGEALNLSLKIDLRGKYRRVKCDFPPLKLSLDKKDAKRLFLDDKYRSIRVVTHCYIDDLGEYDHLEREYLLYKMYQLISPHAYRIKKVKIEYRDTINLTSDIHTALLIEDNDQLAFRVGAYECKNVFNLEESILDGDNRLDVAGFQFMIANADWNTKQLKNVRLFKRGDTYILVPYDFDFAGIVNSKLALPNNNLGLYNMKDRCWVGPDLYSTQELRDKFEPIKHEIHQLILDAEQINLESKNEMKQVVDSFYEIIQSDTLINGGIYKYVPE